MMILAFIVMNGITVWGLAAPKKVEVAAIDTSDATKATVAAPVIDFTLNPISVPLGSSSAFKWSATGNPTCTASSTLPGPWTGEKTQYGAESTGRLSKEGTFEYVLTCKNDGGTTTAKQSITVSKTAVASNGSATKAATSSTASGTAKTYCNNRSPCYGRADVAAHNSAGNCWGWNRDEVFNITKLDKGYHVSKSGISSIEVSGVCGTDLAASLAGSVSAGGQTRNHLTVTKMNASATVSLSSPYWVGYFDSSK
jgi:hypothetical protein